MLAKLVKGGGILSAPLIYALGRAVRSSRVASLSAQLDPEYSRGYDERMRSLGRSAEIMGVFSLAARLCALAGPGTDQVAKELFSSTHAQLLQDLVCLLVHNKKKNGYFVEVGVGDGTTLSNTLILERDFGWTGILAEPNRGFHDKIANTRRAVLDKRAVYEISGTKMRFEEVAGIGELSGLSRHRTERGSQTLSTYDVETVSLDDLLAAHGAPSQIDYMSIDTEGSEVDILKGFSLKNRQVGFFTIEHNHDRRRLRAFRSILQPAGYREILPQISTFDAWFIHRDLQSDYL